jgi:hypothetical protein
MVGGCIRSEASVSACGGHGGDHVVRGVIDVAERRADVPQELELRAQVAAGCAIGAIPLRVGKGRPGQHVHLVGRRRAGDDLRGVEHALREDRADQLEPVAVPDLIMPVVIVRHETAQLRALGTDDVLREPRVSVDHLPIILVRRDEVEVGAGGDVARLAEPAAVDEVGAALHLARVRPAHGIGRADGRFEAGAEPVHLVAGLLPVDAAAVHRGALLHLDDVHDRVRRERILAPSDRPSRDVRGDLGDRLDLGRRREGAVVQRVAPLVGAERLLLAANALGREGLRHLRDERQVELQPVPAHVGAPGVRHHVHEDAVIRADVAVEAPHDVAAGLVERALGPVPVSRLLVLRYEPTRLSF